MAKIVKRHKRALPPIVTMAGESCLRCRKGLYPAQDPESRETGPCSCCGHQANASYKRAEFKKLFDLSLTIAVHNERALAEQNSVDEQKLAVAKAMIDVMIETYPLNEVTLYREAAQYIDEKFAGWNPQKLEEARALSEKTKR